MNRSKQWNGEGWKFLKKLWCCVSGGNKVIWLYQLSWKCKLVTVTSYRADVSSVSPSSELWRMKWWAVIFSILSLKLAIYLRIYQVHENNLRSRWDATQICIVKVNILPCLKLHITSSYYEIILICVFSCSQLLDYPWEIMFVHVIV